MLGNAGAVKPGACVGVRWTCTAKSPARVGVPGFAGVWRDYSTRQARTPPASFLVAVFHRFTCRAHEHHATAAGRSGNRNESPGTISRSSAVIRFVTTLRVGGGMFFVIIGCRFYAVLFSASMGKFFSLFGTVCVFSRQRASLGCDRVSCSTYSFSFLLRGVQPSVFSQSLAVHPARLAQQKTNSSRQ